MIDLHQHLLFGIDDGSPDLATSVAMVQLAAADGITHIVATPHANDTYPYSLAHNQALLQQIRDALPPSTHMQLGLGCDFHLNFENTADARTNAAQYTINQTEYLLVELPDIGIPKRIDEVFYNMRVDGITPILTHPERNATLQRNRAPLLDWVRSGLLLQVTAGSLTGQFGKQAESIAWELLDKQCVQFLATDGHNISRRPPVMGPARDLLAARLGVETATRLTVTNPLAVFNGQPLPASPAPSDLFQGEEEDKPWYKRIFR